MFQPQRRLSRSWGGKKGKFRFGDIFDGCETTLKNDDKSLIYEPMY